jgi:hypothetical protein
MTDAANPNERLPEAAPLRLHTRLLAASAEGGEPNARRWLLHRGEALGWNELQIFEAHNAKRWEQTQFAHFASGDVGRVLALIRQIEPLKPKGIYIVLHGIDPAIATRAEAGKWHENREGKGTSNNDIRVRTELYVDIDPDRPKGISSTDPQLEASHDVAEAIGQRFEKILGGRAAIGYGHSGNGGCVFLALANLPETPELALLIKGILAALRCLHEGGGMLIDVSVSEAKRLAPMFGTMKMKGAPGIPDRPHRRTSFLCEEHVERLSLEQIEAVFAALVAELTDEQRAEVEKAQGRKPAKGQAPSPKASAGPSQPRPQASPPRASSPRQGPDRFAIANAVPIADALDWLGLRDGERPKCPGCGESDAGVAIVQNGLKCSHNRCAAKGHANGFRTVIDLVLEVHGVEPVEALDLVAEQFGLDLPKPPRPEPKVAPSAARGGRSPKGAARPRPSAKRARAEQADQEASDDAGPRPTIESGTELHDEIDAITRALAARPDLNLYTRDGQLVQIVRAEADESGRSPVAAGSPVVRPVAPATLRELCTRAARFKKWDARAGGMLPTLPSDPQVMGLHCRGAWPGVRPLVGIAEAPFLRPDGSICQAPGYDPATGYYLAPSEAFAEVPEQPTQEDARAALAELADLFGDFLFVTKSNPAEGEPRDLTQERDLCVAIGGVLSLIGRPAIASGNVPAFLFTANCPGTGKSLLEDVIALIATGRSAPRTGWRVGDELDKLIGSVAIEGAPLLTFDNMEMPFGGGPIDRILTCEGSDSFRILGRSEWRRCTWRTVVIASGNNLDASGDTRRRALVCALEASLENPETRGGFKYPDLRGHVRQDRGRLVALALTILRAYFVAGCPPMVEPLGSFETWSRLIAGAIRWAGGANILQAVANRVSESADPEIGALRSLLGHWQASIGLGVALTLTALINRLWPEGKPPPEARDCATDAAMREALEQLAGGEGGRPPTAKKLGNALRRFNKRVFGDRRLLCTEDKHAKHKVWTVERVERRGGGVAGSAESAEPVSGRDPQTVSNAHGAPQGYHSAGSAESAGSVSGTPRETVKDGSGDTWEGEEESEVTLSGQRPKVTPQHSADPADLFESGEPDAPANDGEPPPVWCPFCDKPWPRSRPFHCGCSCPAEVARQAERDGSLSLQGRKAVAAVRGARPAAAARHH